MYPAMNGPKYKRVLLKISGEALAGEAHRGLDFDVIGQVCDVVKKCVELGVQVGIVVGGGNFWRGLKDGGDRMERTRADHMGMLATVINALAVADCLEQRGVEVRVQTAIQMNAIAEPYIRGRAIRHLEKGRVVVFGCGTGNPFFSTDTGAVLRAVEIEADAILLAKNIDGVYSADPAKDPTAVKYDQITFDEVLAKHLAVMDTTATSFIGAIVVILALRRKMKTSLFGTSVTKSILTLAVPFVLFGIVDYKEIGLCLWLLFVYLLYAFFEEVGWRGYLYSELIGCKIIHRLLLTTLLWFFWHCRAWQIGDVGFFALLFLASFGLDKLIRDTHSLILVACFHGLFNFYFKCLSDPSHWSSIVCLVITIMLWLYIWYGPKVKICRR